MTNEPEYKFRRPLHRLQDKEEIPHLFDDSDEIRTIRNKEFYIFGLCS